MKVPGRIAGTKELGLLEIPDKFISHEIGQLSPETGWRFIIK